jgi:hypothetical protein
MRSRPEYGIVTVGFETEEFFVEDHWDYVEGGRGMVERGQLRQGRGEKGQGDVAEEDVFRLDVWK